MDAVLRARLDRWEGGDFAALWSEALLDARNCHEDPSCPTSHASNVRRAIRCAEDGRYAKAVAALVSLGTCSPTEKAISSMMEKHPPAPALVLPEGPPPHPMVFLSKIVKGRLQSFPNGSGAGGSGFKPQYFKDIVACPNSFVSEESLESITLLVNIIVVGQASRHIAPFLSMPLSSLSTRKGEVFALFPSASLCGDLCRSVVASCRLTRLPPFLALCKLA